MYYHFKFSFCNIGSPQRKGSCEKSVEFIRRKVFSKRDEFNSYEEAREYLKEKLVKLNFRPQTLQNGKSAMDILALERPHLLPKPPRYDAARIAEPRVNKYACISVDTCYYSVPDSLVGQFVLAKIYADRIVCYHREVLVAEHQRLYGRNLWQIDIAHFTKTLAKKPGAIARSVALSQMEPKLLHIYRQYYQESEKSFIELIELIKKVGINKVEAAISELEKLAIGTVTTDKIVTICQRVDFPTDDKPVKHDCQIEKASKKTLYLYGKLLNNNKPSVMEVR